MTEPFREPVDWRALGLFDYPQVVKQPMDLGAVKKRLEAAIGGGGGDANTKSSGNAYNTVQDCANDVRLIWKNCMAYNADGSEFYLLAEGFAKRFEEKYAKLELTYGTSVLSGAAQATKVKDTSAALNEPTSNEKVAFAKLLYKITKEELGKVINDLDDKCPEALTKNSSEDEVEINVDAISAIVFRDINAFVRKCAGDQQATASKKKKASGEASKSGGRNKKSKINA